MMKADEPTETIITNIELKHKIQAISGRFNVPESQNVVNEIPNQSQPVLLLSEGVDNSAANYDSNKLTFEQQLQGIYEVEFSCEK